jgi:hypothetical protein
MRWFRIHASRIATAGILSLAAMGASAVSPHPVDCDDSCAILLVEHDASAHRIAAPAGGDDNPLHCLVCHWGRSFRTRAETRLATAPASGRGVTLHVEYFTAAVSTSAAQPPLRSPPSPRPS